ncbi:MAG: hypothetical protein ACOX41_03850 [Anaerovoracaceae bacterium]|jgi:hypothetical protein
MNMTGKGCAGTCLGLICIPAYLFFKYAYKKGRYWKETHPQTGADGSNTEIVS